MALVARADAFLAEHGRAEPFGPVDPTAAPLPDHERREQAAALAPVIRGFASTDRLVAAHFSDAPVVLDFLAREQMPRLAALGTSCPDHFLRTKIRPLVIDVPAAAPVDEKVAALRAEHQAYRDAYRAYYDRHAGADSPAIRSADPAIVLVPGVGMWSFGDDAHTARVAGEFYINAINVMRGAESVAHYDPIAEQEAFRIEYWELEERKLRMRPPAPPLRGHVAFVTGAGSGIGRAIATACTVAGACTVVADIDVERAEKVAADLGTDRTMAVAVDVSDEASVAAAFRATALRFGGVDIVVNNAGFADSAPLADTTVASWDRLHDVLARGSFLVSRAGADLIARAGLPGDIVYIVSKNAVAAGPDNIAYGAAKADQAHQVRLLAAELGPRGIRVNGVNPDAVIRGSGIFSGDWLEQRASAHGVEPDDLGGFYASRTLLGLEVLPEHVASAVLALVDGSLARTTGTIIPVDGGVAQAFLR
jgi:rhamnulose-1-phosphate aldolase/alcohol dehydrogenase